MARVAVLMSGGMDSAGAALILKRQGHRVEGVTARLQAAGGDEIGSVHAAEFCRLLGIPHTVVDLRSEFRSEVLHPFVFGYTAGKTPNPCARCNRNIKLGRLAGLMRERGFDLVATGHYARTGEMAGGRTFFEPADKRKSQVYFLSLVKPEVLEFLLLPLGEYRKNDVRRLLDEVGIPAFTRESQDLCFVAGTRYHDVLRREGYVFEQGVVLDSAGKAVGTHKGHAAYTLGQRFGLRGKRYYVIEKHPETNTLVIGERDEALKYEITAVGINSFLPLPAAGSAGLTIRYRYNTAPVGARIDSVAENRLTVVTDQPCFAPAPGQVLAGYVGGCLVFGGTIA